MFVTSVVLYFSLGNLGSLTLRNMRHCKLDEPKAPVTSHVSGNLTDVSLGSEASRGYYRLLEGRGGECGMTLWSSHRATKDKLGFPYSHERTSQATNPTYSFANRIFFTQQRTKDIKAHRDRLY